MGKNFSLLLASNLVTRIFNFLATIYLARIIGVSGFGKISFALAFYAYGSLIADFGLTTLGSREVAKDNERTGEYAGQIISARLILGLGSFILLSVLAFLLPSLSAVKWLIILYALSLFSNVFLLDWVFRGLEKIKYISIGQIIISVIYFFSIITFVHGYQKILFVPVAFLISNVMVTFFFILIFQRGFKKPKLELNIPLIKKLLKRAMPLAASVVIVQIYSNFDKIFLGFIKGEETLGLYTAAFRIVLFVLVIDRIFCTLLLPLSSRSYAESPDKLQETLRLCKKLIVTISIPIGVGGTILARPVMNLIYGSNYEGGVIALQILIWFAVLTIMHSVYTYGLIGSNKEKKFAISVSIGASANIVMNAILIPIFSLTGAAIATVLAELIMLSVSCYFFNKSLSLPFWENIWPPIFAASVMGIILYLIRDINLFLIIATGIIVYFAIIVATRGLSLREIKEINLMSK